MNLQKIHSIESFVLNYIKKNPYLGSSNSRRKFQLLIL